MFAHNFSIKDVSRPGLKKYLNLGISEDSGYWLLFNGILTLVFHSKKNPVYIYIYIYI